MARDEERDPEERPGSRVAAEHHRPESPDGTAPIDDVLDAVSDSKRRAALRELWDREVVTVDELAAAVAARTADAAGPVDDDAREKVSIELAHVHLPALADRGFVEFDRRTSTVTYGDPPRDLEAVLRLVEELEEARDR